MTDYRKQCAAGCGAAVKHAGAECAGCASLARVLRRPTARRGAGARQLDAFAGRDARGVAPQLDLFGAAAGGTRAAQ